jgi:hypothetical protein
VAYCPPEQLEDVADLLAEVRTWPGVVEKKHNVFYLRRQPFLHFHKLSDGRRRADVKTPTGWLQLELPEPITSARRRALLRALRAVHREHPPTPRARG